jgi:hypothetical protein
MPKNDQRNFPHQTKLSCAGCGKPGVGICAKCCKKPKYRMAAVARANPLRNRDPETFQRLDDLSRLPLDGNRNLWDEFCVDIKAGDLYEHLPILVEMVQEGKWRTDALRPKEWLRAQFAGRVKRQRSKVHDRSGQDDYDLAGQRRASGPRFDKRNGALVECEARPYVESEITNGKGGTVSPEEVIDGLYARRELTRADGDRFVKPADRKSLRYLKGMTLAERRETRRCEAMVFYLRAARPVFDKALADAIAHLGQVVEQMKMDQDEAEVLAVEELLWAVGPRRYLNYLEGAHHKRIRNAWDRLDRHKRNRKWAASFRVALSELSANMRWARYLEEREWEERMFPHESFKQERERWAAFGRRLDEPYRRGLVNYVRAPCQCGAADSRFCTCTPSTSPIGGGWAQANVGFLRSDSDNFEVLTLPCDLKPEQRSAYRAIEKKHHSLG